MGYVPVVCQICEGPLDFPKNELTEPLPSDPDDCELSEAVRKGRVGWLSSAVGITGREAKDAFLQRVSGYDGPEWLVDDLPIPLGGYTGWASFELQQSPHHEFSVSGEEERELAGVPCHHACYMLLVKRLKYKLKLSDILPLPLPDASDPTLLRRLMGGDYGGILRYQDQYFHYKELAEDGNLWMIEDPALCERNAQRILDAWRPFADPLVEGVKNKQRQLRNGPCAALFCSFKRASVLAASSDMNSKEPARALKLHEAMACLPSEIVTLIVKLADLAYTKEMADAVV